MRVAFLSVSSELGGSETSLLLLVQNIRRLRPDWRLTIVRCRATAHSRVAYARPSGRPDPAAATCARSSRRVGRRRRRCVRPARRRADGGGRIARRISARSCRHSWPSRRQLVHTNGFKLHILGTWSAASGRAGRLARSRICRPSSAHSHASEAIRFSRRGDRREFAQRGRGSDARARNHARRSARSTTRSIFRSSLPTAHASISIGLRVSRPQPTSCGSASWRPSGAGRAMRRFSARCSGDARRRRPRLRHRRTALRHGRQPVQDGRNPRRSPVSARPHRSRWLHGFVERPAAALRSLDVVVHASTQPEPFGLVIAEGMACGRAVIVSRAGGAVELVEEGVTALTHAPGDAAAWPRRSSVRQQSGAAPALRRSARRVRRCQALRPPTRSRRRSWISIARAAGCGGLR